MNTRCTKFAAATLLFGLAQSSGAAAQVEGSAAIFRWPLPGAIANGGVAYYFGDARNHEKRHGYALSTTGIYTLSSSAFTTLGWTTAALMAGGQSPSYAWGPTASWTFFSATLSYRRDPDFQRMVLPIALTLPLAVVAWSRTVMVLEGGIRGGPVWQWGDGSPRARGGGGGMVALMFHDVGGFGFEAGFDAFAIGHEDASDTVNLVFVVLHFATASEKPREGPPKYDDIFGGP